MIESIKYIAIEDKEADLDEICDMVVDNGLKGENLLGTGVKNYCRDHCEFTMQSLHKHLDIGFSKVTKSTCQKLIKKIWQQEESFWIEDSEVDAREMIEKENICTIENYIDAEDDDFLHI